NKRPRASSKSSSDEEPPRVLKRGRSDDAGDVMLKALSKEEYKLRNAALRAGYEVPTTVCVFVVSFFFSEFVETIEVLQKLARGGYQQLKLWASVLGFAV